MKAQTKAQRDQVIFLTAHGYACIEKLPLLGLYIMKKGKQVVTVDRKGETEHKFLR